MKIKPCTIEPKHKWEWKKDVTLTTAPSPNMRILTARGLYRCACGEVKYGEPRSGL